MNVPQTVAVDTDTSPMAEVEEQSAQDDLDSLLSEFDEETTGESKETPDSGEQTDVEVRLATLEEEKRQEEFRKDISRTIDVVRGDIKNPIFDDVFMESYIDAEARRDPRFAKVWVGRKSNPQTFNKAVEALHRVFKEKYGSDSIDEDVAAMESAVHSAQTARPSNDEVDFSSMSDVEFGDYKRKLAKGR